MKSSSEYDARIAMRIAPSTIVPIAAHLFVGRSSTTFSTAVIVPFAPIL